MYIYSVAQTNAVNDDGNLMYIMIIISSSGKIHVVRIRGAVCSPSRHTIYLMSTPRKDVYNLPQTIPPAARC